MSCCSVRTMMMAIILLACLMFIFLIVMGLTLVDEGTHNPKSKSNNNHKNDNNRNTKNVTFKEVITYLWQGNSSKLSRNAGFYFIFALVGLIGIAITVSLLTKRLLLLYFAELDQAAADAEALNKKVKDQGNHNTKIAASEELDHLKV